METDLGELEGVWQESPPRRSVRERSRQRRWVAPAMVGVAFGVAATLSGGVLTDDRGSSGGSTVVREMGFVQVAPLGANHPYVYFELNRADDPADENWCFGGTDSVDVVPATMCLPTNLVWINVGDGEHGILVERQDGSIEEADKQRVVVSGSLTADGDDVTLLVSRTDRQPGGP